MVFDRHGPLAARIPEYRERSQQVEMANRVAGAIRDDAVLVCEAGTGTGKTFAYLVPALLSAGGSAPPPGAHNPPGRVFTPPPPPAGRAAPTPRAPPPPQRPPPQPAP